MSFINGSKGRHLEWVWPIGVSQLQRICCNSLATHRQQQPLGRRGRRDEQGAFLACPHESTLTASKKHRACSSPVYSF